jgi:hypothetical protein
MKNLLNLKVGIEGDREREVMDPLFHEHLVKLDGLIDMHQPDPEVLDEIVGALNFFCTVPIMLDYAHFGGIEQTAGKLISVRIPPSAFRNAYFEWVYDFVHAMPRKI